MSLGKIKCPCSVAFGESLSCRSRDRPQVGRSLSGVEVPGYLLRPCCPSRIGIATIWSDVVFPLAVNSDAKSKSRCSTRKRLNTIRNGELGDAGLLCSQQPNCSRQSASALCPLHQAKAVEFDGQVDASKSIKRMMSLIVNNPPRTLLLTKTRHFVESLALLP